MRPLHTECNNTKPLKRAILSIGSKFVLIHCLHGEWFRQCKVHGVNLYIDERTILRNQWEYEKINISKITIINHIQLLECERLFFVLEDCRQKLIVLFVWNVYTFEGISIWSGNYCVKNIFSGVHAELGIKHIQVSHKIKVFSSNFVSFLSS